MEVAIAGVFLVLVYLGWEDHKERKLPDAALSLLWLLMIYPMSAQGSLYQAGLMGLFFAVLYFVNSWATIAKHPILAWGDILICPPYFAFLAVLGQGWLAIMFVLPLGIGFLLKQKQPVAPWLVLGALIAARLALLA